MFKIRLNVLKGLGQTDFLKGRDVTRWAFHTYGGRAGAATSAGSVSQQPLSLRREVTEDPERPLDTFF